MESPPWLPDLLQIHQTQVEKLVQAQAREAFAIEQMQTFAAYFAAGTAEYLRPYPVPRVRDQSRSQTIWMAYWRSMTPVVIAIHHKESASTLCLEVDERRLWTYSLTTCEPVDFTPAIEAFKRWMQSQPLVAAPVSRGGGRLQSYLQRTRLVRRRRERRGFFALSSAAVTGALILAVVYFASWAAMMSQPPAAASFYPDFLSETSNISAQQWASLRTMQVAPNVSLGSLLPTLAQEDLAVLGEAITVQTIDGSVTVSIPMGPHSTFWIFREQAHHLIAANAAARQLTSHPRVTVDTLLGELNTMGN